MLVMEQASGGSGRKAARNHNSSSLSASDSASTSSTSSCENSDEEEEEAEKEIPPTILDSSPPASPKISVTEDDEEKMVEDEEMKNDDDDEDEVTISSRSNKRPKDGDVSKLSSPSEDISSLSARHLLACIGAATSLTTPETTDLPTAATPPRDIPTTPILEGQLPHDFTDLKQLESDKKAVYSHPLFPLLGET